MAGLADNLVRSTLPTIKDPEYWVGAARRAGTRLDAARETMTAECAADRALPSEDRMGKLESDVGEARIFYRACIEKLTGQSADDVERRMGA